MHGDRPSKGFAPSWRLLSALLVGEINVHYVYGLLVRVDRHPVVALHVDQAEAAGRVLKRAGAMLVGQDEIDVEQGG